LAPVLPTILKGRAVLPVLVDPSLSADNNDTAVFFNALVEYEGEQHGFPKVEFLLNASLRP
jgi:hypothetical protein